MPMNLADYPSNWKNMVLAVKARAGEIVGKRYIDREAKCEDCGLENHKYYHRLEGNIIKVCHSNWGETCPVCCVNHKPVLIVLTVAHLDHDPENDDVCITRLRAWCQKCHLAYDAPVKRYNRDIRRGQEHLFPLET